MKNIILAVLTIVVLVGGFMLFSNNSTPESVENAEYSAFSDTETGISFEYKTEPDGYVVEDLSSFIRNEVEDVEVVAVYRVINEREKIELETSEGGREGPPTINILVFKNTNNQSASMWVDSYPLFSNTDFLIGDIDRDAVVGGANAVQYRTDGLYQGQNVVVAQGGYIYQFIGSFLEENSSIYRDFNTLIDSVVFIPMVDTVTPVDNATPQSKVDIRVACESALAYMTFMSGEDADLFVEACIEGEHPEVIERYIKETGLDGSLI